MSLNSFGAMRPQSDIAHCQIGSLCGRCSYCRRRKLFHPEPPAFRAVLRCTPLQDTHETFDAWIVSETPFTYSEFLEYNWSNAPLPFLLRGMNS